MMDDSGELSSFDLYSDIITDSIKQKEHSYNELEKKFDESQQLIKELQEQLKELTTRDALSQTQNVNLKKNISSLYNTAKVELARKDQEIVRLRKCIDNRWRRQQRNNVPRLSLHTRSYRDALSRSSGLDNSQDAGDTCDSEMGRPSGSTSGLGFSQYALGRRESRDNRVPSETRRSTQSRLVKLEPPKASNRAATESNYEEHRTINVTKHSKTVLDPPDKVEDFVAQVREELKDEKDCYRGKSRSSVSASSPYIVGRKKDKPDHRSDKNFIDVSRGRLEGRLVKYKPMIPVISHTRNRNEESESPSRSSGITNSKKHNEKSDLFEKTKATSNTTRKKQNEKIEPSVKERKVPSDSPKCSNKVLKSEVSKPPLSRTVETKKRRRNSTEEGTASKRSNKRSSPRTRSPPRPLKSVNCVKKEAPCCDLKKYLQKTSPKEDHGICETGRENKVKNDQIELCQKSDIRANVESRAVQSASILKRAEETDLESEYPVAKADVSVAEVSSVMKEGELEDGNRTSNFKVILGKSLAEAPETDCAMVNTPVEISSKSVPDINSATSVSDTVSSNVGPGIVTESNSSLGIDTDSCLTSCDGRSREASNPAPVASRRRSSGCTVTSTTLWESNNGVTTWIQSPEIVNGVQKFRLKLSNSETSLKSSEASNHSLSEQPVMASDTASRHSCSKESVLEKSSNVNSNKKKKSPTTTRCMKQSGNASKIISEETSIKASVHEKSLKGNREKKENISSSKPAASKAEKPPRRNSSSGKNKTPKKEKEMDRSTKRQSSTNSKKVSSTSKRVQSTEDSRRTSRDHTRPSASSSVDRRKSLRRSAERVPSSCGDKSRGKTSVINDSLNLEASESLLSIPDDVYIFLGEESSPLTAEKKPSDGATNFVITDLASNISDKAADVANSVWSDTGNLPETPMNDGPNCSNSDMLETKPEEKESESTAKLSEDKEKVSSGSPELKSACAMAENNELCINPVNEDGNSHMEYDDSCKVKFTEDVSVEGCKHDARATDTENKKPCKIMQSAFIEDGGCDRTFFSMKNETENSCKETNIVPVKVTVAVSVEEAVTVEYGECDLTASSMENENLCKETKAVSVEDAESDLNSSSMVDEDSFKVTKAVSIENASSVEDGECEVTASSMENEDSCQSNKAVVLECAEVLEPFINANRQQNPCDEGTLIEQGDTETDELFHEEMANRKDDLKETMIERINAEEMASATQNATPASKGEPYEEQGQNDSRQLLSNSQIPSNQKGEECAAEEGEITSESGESTSDSEVEEDGDGLSNEHSHNELPINDLRQKLQMKRENLVIPTKEKRNPGNRRTHGPISGPSSHRVDRDHREVHSPPHPRSSSMRGSRQSPPRTTERDEGKRSCISTSRSSPRSQHPSLDSVQRRDGCRSPSITHSSHCRCHQCHNSSPSKERNSRSPYRSGHQGQCRQAHSRGRSYSSNRSSHNQDTCTTPGKSRSRERSRSLSPVIKSNETRRGRRPSSDRENNEEDRGLRSRSSSHHHTNSDLDNKSLRERDRNISSCLGSRADNRPPLTEREQVERHRCPVSSPSSHKVDRNHRDVRSPPRPRSSSLRGSRHSPPRTTERDNGKLSRMSSQSSPRSQHPSLDSLQRRDRGRGPLTHASHCRCRQCHDPSPSRERSSHSPHRSCHDGQCREARSRGRSYSSNHSSQSHETSPGKPRSRERSRSHSPGGPPRERHRLERNDSARERQASSDHDGHRRARERSDVSPSRGRNSNYQSHGSDLIERKRKRPPPNLKDDRSVKLQSGGHSGEKRKRQH